MGPTRRGLSGALLRMLGIKTENQPGFSTPREWIEWMSGKRFPRPTPRMPMTRGWHVKRNRRRGPNYAKLLRRQARAAA